ncbi:hypothetical protein AnigIFM50267_002127 [Aspergillus niger]|nr:hypothetical protein AnigIFM50267_002127 [Aspergillus niger]
MAGNNKRGLDMPDDNFTESLLPLHNGPYVTLQVGSEGRKYKVSRPLLCKHSPYFRAMFESGYKESHEQAVTMHEIEGVVTERSLEMLLQWLYLGRLHFQSSSPEECITVYIELARLADMCNITGMEQILANKIKTIITSSIPHNSLSSVGGEDSKILYLTPDHIEWASMLLKGHPVRSLIAEASAGAFILMENFKFADELREIPNYTGDLLDELKSLIKGQIHDNNVINHYKLTYWKDGDS